MRLQSGDVLLAWPLAQHIITAGWTYTSGAAHNALDFRASVSTPVYAAEAGTVVTAYRWTGKVTKGDTNSYGNFLKLRHDTYNGKRLETLYAHLDKLCVAKGDTVTEGQLIGYSGCTGNCYGAHLHFEVRYGGKRVNPLNWLDSDFTAASDAVRAHLGGYTSVTRPADTKQDTKEDTMADTKLQRPTITPPDQDGYIEIAKLMCTLGLPMQTEASTGDAMTLMHAAQARGAGYTSVWVEG